MFRKFANNGLLLLSEKNLGLANLGSSQGWNRIFFWRGETVKQIHVDKNEKKGISSWEKLREVGIPEYFPNTFSFLEKIPPST